MAKIQNIEELHSFLCNWYDEPDLGVEPSNWVSTVPVAHPITDAWTLLGKLFVGYEEWLKIGEPSPLACQDGFAAPGFLIEADKRIDFAFENQGNWSAGYLSDDYDADPEVISDWINLDKTGAGYVRVGTRLSEYLITIILSETIFFGNDTQEDKKELAQNCHEILWIGKYYNAVGFGQDYDIPSHRIRTNKDRTLLVLDWDETFSGFIASQDVSRQKWKAIKRK